MIWFKRNEANILGKLGEKKVKKILSHLDPNHYIVLNDLYVPKGDQQTSQIDHLVISSCGIFIIETKNYKGWIFGSEDSQYWKQVIYKKKSNIYNPIRQNAGHIQAIKNYLGNVMDEIPIYSIIVFTNKANLKFKNPFQQAAVIKCRHLLETIKNRQQSNSISNFRIQEIKEKLAKLIVTDQTKQKKLAKQHIHQVRQDLHRKQEKIYQDICPRCGNKLVKRSGKHGSFKGCSHYPACKFTAKIH